MERLVVTDMEGAEHAVVPTAGDRMRGGRALRNADAEVTVGNLYLFVAFEAMKRTGGTQCDDVMAWADTIHNVNVRADEDEPDPASAEGEGGATPAE